MNKSVSAIELRWHNWSYWRLTLALVITVAAALGTYFFWVASWNGLFEVGLSLNGLLGIMLVGIFARVGTKLIWKILTRTADRVAVSADEMGLRFHRSAGIAALAWSDLIEFWVNPRKHAFRPMSLFITGPYVPSLTPPVADIVFHLKGMGENDPFPGISFVEIDEFAQDELFRLFNEALPPHLSSKLGEHS